MTKPTAAQPDESTLAWRPVLDCLRAGWPTVAAAVAAALLVGALLGWVAEEPYAATATLALARPEARLAFDARFRDAELDPSFPYRVGSLRVYPELAASEDIAAEVRSRLDDRLPAGWTAADLQARWQARAAADGTLLFLTVRADSPGRATDAANAWADVLVERMAALFGDAGEPGQRASVDAARDEAASAVAQARAELEAFHAGSEIGPGEVELEALETRYARILDAQDRLEAVARDAAALAAVATDANGTGSEARRTTLATLVLSLSALSSELPQGAELSLPADPAGLATDPAALAASVASLRADLEAEAQALPEGIRMRRSALEAERLELKELERRHELAVERLTTLARRADELAVAEDTQRPELRLAAAAVPPGGRDLAPLLRSLLAAGLLGAAAGVAVVLGRCAWRRATAAQA